MADKKKKVVKKVGKVFSDAGEAAKKRRRIRDAKNKVVKGVQKVKTKAERALRPPKGPRHEVEYSTKGEKGKTPAVPMGPDLGDVDLAKFQRGIQNAIRDARRDGVGIGELRSIIKHAIPSTILTAGAGATVYKITENQNKKLKAELKKAIHRADAPTKKEYMKAVDPKTPPETARADKSFEDFMSGKKGSLGFKKGGIIKTGHKDYRKGGIFY